MSLLLEHAIRGTIGELLKRPGVTDIFRNADGRLWCVEGGKTFDAGTIGEPEANVVLGIIADHADTVIRDDTPILHARMPTGERIAGSRPPVTDAACFSIRVPPRVHYSISDFVPRPDQSIRSRGTVERPARGWLETIEWAIEARVNMLISAPTGVGKTSLLRAMLRHKRFAEERLFIAEQTPELWAASPNVVYAREAEGVGMDQLIGYALRAAPACIIVGEVRYPPEAVQLVLAMQTGHSGSVATIHGGTAAGGRRRLATLCRGELPREIVEESFPLVVQMCVNEHGERVICEMIFEDEKVRQ